MHQDFDQVIARSARRWCSALAMLVVVLAAAPASAGEMYSKFKIDALHKWSIGKWTIWAMPNHVCLAMDQEINFEKPQFWGFIIGVIILDIPTP